MSTIIRIWDNPLVDRNLQLGERETGNSCERYHFTLTIKLLDIVASNAIAMYVKYIQVMLLQNLIAYGNSPNFISTKVV